MSKKQQAKSNKQETNWTIKEGILKNFFPGSYTADIQPAENPQLERVQVAKNIAKAEMIADRQVLIAMRDQARALIIAVQ